jgi:hypothetical protein
MLFVLIFALSGSIVHVGPPFGQLQQKALGRSEEAAGPMPFDRLRLQVP